MSHAHVARRRTDAGEGSRAQKQSPPPSDVPAANKTTAIHVHGLPRVHIAYWPSGDSMEAAIVSAVAEKGATREDIQFVKINGAQVQMSTTEELGTAPVSVYAKFPYSAVHDDNISRIADHEAKTTAMNAVLIGLAENECVRMANSVLLQAAAAHRTNDERDEQRRWSIGPGRFVRLASTWGIALELSKAGMTVTKFAEQAVNINMSRNETAHMDVEKLRRAAARFRARTLLFLRATAESEREEDLEVAMWVIEHADKLLS
eukprot:TRINITY_DN3080_c0_g1_i1.p1 TRINITY_DN3080_c0_g1~~TRINITY_DN3080_c0_g1_i1.p1  ORF type:complete len:261 (-),score=28.02 TRINITY_DN3080_c0_g1_i1:289-1071(-)